MNVAGLLFQRLASRSCPVVTATGIQKPDTVRLWPILMDFWIIIVGGLLAGCAAWAWWRLQSLTKKIGECTRRQYYDQSKFLDTTRQQSDALTILRLQLAQVVAGNAPDGALVESGCLYRDISAEDAGQMALSQPATTNGELVIVDVRSHKEFLAGHIPGAIHAPLEELETRGQRDVPRDAATVLVYCSQGERSRLACDFLSRRGYMNLVNIRDGFQNWPGPVLGAGNATLLQIQPTVKSQAALSTVEPVEPAEDPPHG